jgi:hypothetical protein
MLHLLQGQPRDQQVAVGGAARVGAGQRPEVVTNQGRRIRPEPVGAQGLGDHRRLVGTAAAGLGPIDILDGQQVNLKGPDPGHDGVQVHLVGPFPAGAGDVLGPNPQARHRSSIAEGLPPDQREGGPLVPAENRLRPGKARITRLKHAGKVELTVRIRSRSDARGAEWGSHAAAHKAGGNHCGNPGATTRHHRTGLDEIGPAPEQPGWFLAGPVGRFRSDSYRKVVGSNPTSRSTSPQLNGPIRG